MYEYLFDNAWWLFIWTKFSVSFLLGLGLLKIVAVLYPGTKTNQIIELIQGLIFRTKPGTSETEPDKNN